MTVRFYPLAWRHEPKKMGLLSEIVQYFQNNPRMAMWAGFGLLVLYFVLNWKPKRTREADAQLSRMLRDRDDHYRQQRPPSR